jgi:enoyl-CoA hydratase/carnithine racemase|tara:strand:+ start:65 stop:1183 length:1119 start_codon:yes stop_codon:yes gene_type:complete
MSAAQKVLFAKQSVLRVATLNSPKSLNALDLDMVRLLSKQFAIFEDNETIGALILDGAKSSKVKSFCAGGDIVNLHANASAPETRNKCTEFFLEEYTLNYMLKHYKKPIVSILNGITMGGGVGVSVHGAFRIATENTVFAMPECSIGFFPDVGLTHLLPSLPIGTYLGMTGERLKGQEVVDAGIATHFCHSTDVPYLLETINTAALHHTGSYTNDADIFEVVELAINSVAIEGQPATSVKQNMNEIMKVFDVDLSTPEAIDNIAENLKESESDWSNSALKKMQAASPFALQATRELFSHSQKGTANFGEQLSREFEATKVFMAHPDFVEGVSAAVIERRKPEFGALEGEWKPIVDGHTWPIDFQERVDALIQ